MDIEWMMDFLELAATKSFTQAAKNRYVSQPAFSRRILALEQWVGVTLIDRSVHPFVITREGEHFRKVTQGVVKTIYRTLDECRQSQRGHKDFIKFTALHTLAINYFAEWIADIQSDYGSVRTTMHANNVYDCVELLQSRRAEFMLSYSTPTIPSLLNASDFLSCKLKGDELILVSAADVRGKPLFKINSKKPLDYLAYTSDCLMGKMTERMIETECAERPFNCVYENDVAESIKAMAIKGIGVAWLPHICIKSEIERGELIRIGGKKYAMDLDIMLFRAAQTLSDEAEALWRYLNPGEVPLIK